MSNRKNPRMRARRSYKPLWTILGVLVVIAIIIFTVVQLGIPQRTLAAIYVGDEKVTVAEWNYYYNQEKLAIAQSLGISPLHINLKEESPFGDDLGDTWGELLDNATRRRIQQTYVKKQEIEAIGETFTEEDRLEVDSVLTQLRMNFADEGQMRTYLEQTYGIGVTPELLEKIERDNLMARKCDSNYRESLEFTDQEIQDFYDANPEEYQVVKYHLIEVDTTVGEDADAEHDHDHEHDHEDEVINDAEVAEEETDAEVTDETDVDETEATDEVTGDEDVEETDENADTDETEGTDGTEGTDDADMTEQERVDAMLEVFEDDLKTSRDFQQFAEEYEDLIVSQSAAVRNATNEDDPTYFERSRDSIYPEAVRTWLYDEAREADGVTRIDVEDTAYFVLFVDMAPNETLTADITYRYFPTAHADNTQMTVHEVDQLRVIAEEYAESIESAEDLEVGPEAEIILTTESVTGTDDSTTEDENTDVTDEADETVDADEADATDATDDEVATDGEVDATEDAEANEDAAVDGEEDTEEAVDEDTDATDEDADATDETEDGEVSVPIVSYGPYHNEEVHSAFPLLAEVTAAALETEAGGSTVVVTFNGIYVVYVNERGPKEDWAARAEQDLSLERFNAQLTEWYEEDERYQLRDGSLGGFFTE